LLSLSPATLSLPDALPIFEPRLFTTLPLIDGSNRIPLHSGTEDLPHGIDVRIRFDRRASALHALRGRELLLASQAVDGGFDGELQAHWLTIVRAQSLRELLFERARTKVLTFGIELELHRVALLADQRAVQCKLPHHPLQIHAVDDGRPVGAAVGSRGARHGSGGRT